MDEERIEQFRQKLLGLRTELQEQEELGKEMKGPVELDQTKVGRLSRMDAMQGQQLALEAARRRQHHLTKVEGALRRMESDEYGTCFICEEEIDVRRLSFDPTNTRCVGCVEK